MLVLLPGQNDIKENRGRKTRINDICLMENLSGYLKTLSLSIRHESIGILSISNIFLLLHKSLKEGNDIISTKDAR